MVPLPFEVEAMPTPSNDAGEALAAGPHLIASVYVTQRAEPPSLLLIEAHPAASCRGPAARQDVVEPRLHRGRDVRPLGDQVYALGGAFWRS